MSEPRTVYADGHVWIQQGPVPGTTRTVWQCSACREWTANPLFAYGTCPAREKGCALRDRVVEDRVTEGPVRPAPSVYICECGATVRVGMAHTCTGRVRPMRSAGPLMGSDGYDGWARARAEEEERINGWDEIYDDHLPPEWARRPPSE